MVEIRKGDETTQEIHRLSRGPKQNPSTLAAKGTTAEGEGGRRKSRADPDSAARARRKLKTELPSCPGAWQHFLEYFQEKSKAETVCRHGRVSVR